MKTADAGTLTVIADGAAFGAYMESVLAAMRVRNNVLLYLPESFEWMILRSGAVGGQHVQEILNHPENYIDSSDYFSWEQFFTDLLRQCTADDPKMRYDKTRIREYYVGDRISSRIFAVIPEDVRKSIRGQDP